MTPTLLWKKIEGYFSKTYKGKLRTQRSQTRPWFFSSFFFCVRLFCTRIRAKEHEKEKNKKDKKKVVRKWDITRQSMSCNYYLHTRLSELSIAVWVSFSLRNIVIQFLSTWEKSRLPSLGTFRKEERWLFNKAKFLLVAVPLTTCRWLGWWAHSWWLLALKKW